MLGIRRWAYAAPLAMALAAGAAPGAARAQTGAAALDALVDAAAARGFSGVVLVGATGADSVLYERAVGVADRATGRALRVDDVWRWASVTKQVTAALVLRQVDAGRIALDAPVARYLPDFAGPTGGAVTVRHLLQHTSGLPNPESTPRGADGVPAFYHAAGVSDAHAAAAGGHCAASAPRAPGESFEYNNCDYLVLGALLERVTGRRYADLVRETLGEGLGLRSVSLATGGATLDRLPVAGYEADGSREPAMNLATYGAAGGLSGTPRDLLAFDRALAGHRLVSAGSTGEMWRGEPKLGYAALGAWIFPARLRGCPAPVRLVERRGAIGGVQVRNVIAPELGRAVIVFANDAGVAFGGIWQGAGLSHDLLSAALCPPANG